MRIRAPRILMYLPAALVTFAAVGAPRPASGQRVETFAVRRAIDTIDVRIQLARSDLFIERTGRDTITITAEPFDTAVAAPEVNAAFTGTTLTIDDGDGATSSRAVRLRVGIPRSVTLTVRLGRGDVHIRGLDGTFDVSSQNGSVLLDGIGGAALVDLLNGSIDLSYRAADPGLPSVLTTLNGNVTVRGVPAAGVIDIRCHGCDVALLRAGLVGSTLQSLPLRSDTADPVYVVRRGPADASAWLRILAWNGQVSVATARAPVPE